MDTLAWSDHFHELRKRCFIIVGFWLAASLVLYSLSGTEHILRWALAPLQEVCPRDTVLARTLWDAFFTHLTLALWGGGVMTLPVFLWQTWQFIKPALFPHERPFFLFCLALSVMFGSLGLVIAYTWMMPKAWAFFLSFYAPPLHLWAGLNEYMKAFFTILLGMAASFQMPVLMILSWKLGWIPPRKKAILAISTFSAIITPPDWFSPIALTGILYSFYEILRYILQTWDQKSG